MEVEAELALVLYAFTALVAVLIPIIFVLMIWIKRLINNNEDDREFAKLMIQLYEQEKQKNEKIDEGGFGT